MTAKRIKTFRESSGLSQRQLAEKMGVCWQTVRYWETGERSPPFEKLIAMAKILSVPRDVFFDEELDS